MSGIRSSLRALFALAALSSAGCGGRYVVVGQPARPFDVAIVPGCPSEADGSLSYCQKGRALWAAALWHRGDVPYFVVSGAAVHGPYVEAEGLAEAMAALGVPPDRIYLEPNALHTDENMYLSLRIARALGFRRIAIASNRGQAASGCLMLADWGHADCHALPFDERPMRALHEARPGALEGVRSRAVERWISVAERERAIARRTGRSRRPPSFVLYPYLGWLRLAGAGPWIPANVPRETPILTWAFLAREAGGPSAGSGRALRAD